MSMRFIFLTLGILALTSCSNSTPETPQRTVLTPLPSKVKEPDNKALTAALKSYLAENAHPAATGYEFNRIDLNGDRRRDAIMLLKSPFGYWCENNGCTMLVFRANENDFTFVSKTTPLREPVFISENRTNGWKNLVVRVSGRWSKAKDVAMRFNGQTYPAAPDKLPPITIRDEERETRIFR